MATALTNIGGLLPTIYAPTAQNGLYENNIIFSLFPPEEVPAGSGSNAYWTALGAGTLNAEATTEGATAAATNVMVAPAMQVAFQSFHVQASITDQAARYGSRSIGDPWAVTIAQAARNLNDVINDTFVTTLVAAIDSAGNYAGQTRSSYADLFVSGEESTTTALTLAYMYGAVQNLTNAGKGVARNEILILTSEALKYSYQKLTAGTELASARNQFRPAGSPVADGGLGWDCAFDGIPMVVCPTMDSGTMLFVKKGMIHVKESIPLKLKALGAVGAVDAIELLWAGQIIVEAPAFAYKLGAKT